MRLLPLRPIVSRTLFRFVSEDSSFGLETDAEEMLVFSSAAAGRIATVKFGRKLASGQAVVVAIAVTPFGDSWNVGLEVDGELLERTAVQAPFSSWPNIGELGIAVPDGFIGIIDEFGVQLRR
jgi:hypothetical protein